MLYRWPIFASKESVSRSLVTGTLPRKLYLLLARDYTLLKKGPGPALGIRQIEKIMRACKHYPVVLQMAVEALKPILNSNDDLWEVRPLTP